MVSAGAVRAALRDAQAFSRMRSRRVLVLRLGVLGVGS